MFDSSLPLSAICVGWNGATALTITEHKGRIASNIKALNIAWCLEDSLG